MRILLTNDDGIYARGISALYDELSKDDDCLIVAPEIEQSAVGHAITLFRPLMVRSATKGGGFLGYAVYGTPADCVKIGIKELSDRLPDLVVSGINRGANVGVNLIYSGTVSAATEAVIMGVPALAISLDTHQDADFTFAAQFARKLVSQIKKGRSLQGSAMNVNVPSLPEEKIKGIAVVRQGRGNIIESFEKRTDPRGNIYYWISGETLTAETDLQTDVSALAQGYITVTPIQYDLTRYDLLDPVKNLLADHF